MVRELNIKGIIASEELIIKKISAANHAGPIDLYQDTRTISAGLAS